MVRVASKASCSSAQSSIADVYPLSAPETLSAPDGRIAVIDPAVCYAWGEIDLSMLWCEERPDESRRFFDVYQELNPRDAGTVLPAVPVRRTE